VQQVLLEFGAQAGERRGIVAIALFTRILDQVVEFAEALPPTSNLDPIATNKGRDTQLEAAITEVRPSWRSSSRSCRQQRRRCRRPWETSSDG
jgi:hypothetical protein